jgi:hypothetical protein
LNRKFTIGSLVRWSNEAYASCKSAPSTSACL